MKKYIKLDPWKVIEDKFIPGYNRISESLCSIGNGRMGQRANFEERYSGDHHQGNYIAGVYYPDKTRVGWWKNGYPEYFAKVINSTNWIGIDISIDKIPLDLATCTVKSFKRILNMKKGYLERSFVAALPNGKEIKVNIERFLSIVDDEIGTISYTIIPLNFDGTISFTPYLDGDVENEDSNDNIKFWQELQKETTQNEHYLAMKTKKLDFHIATGMTYVVTQNNKPVKVRTKKIEKRKYIASTFNVNVKKGQATTLYKYAATVSSLNYSKKNLIDAAKISLKKAFKKGYKNLKKEQIAAWAKKWKESDIIIDGDVAAQQAIRFNIFQLNQTYTGEDERLNIGPKGFTGEKYGGSTYWDTEAYCIPFYLSTADQKVAKNLLIYRYKHLARAIENAQKLGFKNGAALYPMVTMNGEECHNEWEITFEEIHRNGAIAFAIYNYIRYTGDAHYLIDYGTEVLVGIARFWAQRITFSNEKSKYVMLGVTGPNEYENNVNNNWYTNTIATWCLNYALEALNYVKEHDLKKYEKLQTDLSLNIKKETEAWKLIAKQMYYPVNETLGIFLQQDGFMDKEQTLVDELDPCELPLNQHWSWDRILRSIFIKQADVLQGLYFFEDHYDLNTIKKNYDFYEPRTVHESSLSPCVHSILAAKLGYQAQSYQFYLRTARLDLDDYNNDTKDGCHITSMAGTWMSIVQGFGGMRVKENALHFNPFIPKQWKLYSFTIRFRDWKLKIAVSKKEITIENLSDQALSLYIHGKKHFVTTQKPAIEKF